MQRGEIWWADLAEPRGSDQVMTLRRDFLTKRISRLSTSTMADVEAGLRLVLSL